ncbi:TRAP transporter substrate-binding protein [Pokkaliibacter sp. CJK22405]|uniref:TRAP transporter substrate-binding protein n=1 Tax=Pokkaliibacter sp. CJK22405 TaxID=3384615 RepID=UPI0039847A5B
MKTSKSMLKTLTAAALGVALSVGAVAASAADIKPRLIRFGYGLNQDSKQGRAVDYFAEELGKLSGGKFKVKTFGGAALGSDVQMQNALIGGAQELLVGSTSTLVGIDPRMGVWDLPFLFDSAEQADKVLDGDYGQKLLDGLQEHGLVGLVYWENGFRNLTNSKRPIEKMSDLDGIKLRVMQNPMYLDLFKSMGANAVPMSFSELFTALETKAVDGQENPVTTIQSSKFYEVQPYLSLTRHVYSPWIVTMSKVFWDKLSDDEKAIVMEAAKKSRDFERKDSREQAVKAMAFLKENGMKINEVPADEVAKMREKAQAVINAQASVVGQDTLDGLRAAIAATKE